MLSMRSFLVLIFAGVVLTAAQDYNETDGETYDGPRPVRDRFRAILNNANEEKVSDEIADFTAYGCEKMVVIRNRAQEEFQIACQSFHDTPKKTVIQPGNAYSFSFRPQKSGKSKFWCNIEYKQTYARFDVYNEDLSYMCPRDIDEVYQYVVHHDGIYVDKNKGSPGQKIRSLYKGHNKFVLWEEFVNGTADGFLFGAFIDGGMCFDIPEKFNDKAAAASVCYNHCVKLYEHYGCHGAVQVVQAQDECHDAAISEELKGKLSAIQGC